MGFKWLLQLYHHYALLLGVTSHRFESGSYRQTWLTRSYALLLNIFVLLALPFSLYKFAQTIEAGNWFPKLLFYTTYVFYSVSYVATAYAIISRGTRDRALLEMERIVRRMKRFKSQESVSAEHQCRRSLLLVFDMKLGTLILICVLSLTSCLMMPADEKNLTVLMYGFIFGNALNIPLIATHRYFMALWDIAYCYQSINVNLEHLMKCVRSRYPTKVELKEFHRLWSLHELLGRSTLEMNRAYGLLMLTARFDNLVSSVINAYWGILISYATEVPILMMLWSFINYSTRLLDFFLLNFMCDLTVQHQTWSYHSVTEGYWFKELHAYLLYASTSKMKLWVCGLFEVNRKCWYQMLGSILNFIILLFQFHMVAKKVKQNVEY